MSCCLWCDCGVCNCYEWLVILVWWFVCCGSWLLIFVWLMCIFFYDLVFVLLNMSIGLDIVVVIKECVMIVCC